jgi:hypothetical protein
MTTGKNALQAAIPTISSMLELPASLLSAIFAAA